MELSLLIVEAEATLRDPAFAFGFFCWCLIVGIVTFVVLQSFPSSRHEVKEWWVLLVLVTPLLILFARSGIAILANLAFMVLTWSTGSVHYWFMRPYVITAQILGPVGGAALFGFRLWRTRTKRAAA